MSAEVHNLTLSLDELGRGFVKLDGRLVKGCTGIKIDSRVGDTTRATIEINCAVELVETAVELGFKRE